MNRRKRQVEKKSKKGLKFIVKVGDIQMHKCGSEIKNRSNKEIVCESLKEQAKRAMLASLPNTGVKGAIFEEHVIHKVCNNTSGPLKMG